MAAAIKARLPQVEVELVPGGRGDFIVTAGAQRLWDKRRMNDAYPDDANLVAQVATLLA